MLAKYPSVAFANCLWMAPMSLDSLPMLHSEKKKGKAERKNKCQLNVFFPPTSSHPPLS